MTFSKVVKGRKFTQVLEGARTVFLRDGFEGASVDDIAREAGVSKATLYSYFPEKKMMLIEVARAEFHQLADAAYGSVDLNDPAEKLLLAAAQIIATSTISEFSIQVFRLSVAETVRFPALAREYYRSGPEMLAQRVGFLILHLANRGDLVVDDVELAATQFGELASTRLHDLAQFGMRDEITDAEIDRVVKGAVRVFIAAYGSDALRATAL